MSHVVSCRAPRLIPAAAFTTGFASIATEISASRLLAPFFGSSTFIWATLIGVTLLFLALGYWLGGRVIDARPDARLLYFMIGAAGIALALIIPTSRPILRSSLVAFDNRNAGAFLGCLIASLILFSPTLILLGMVAPAAVRLRLSSVEDAGKAAGSLYAISTTGSILGSFLPVIFLLPEIGTRRTFAVLAAIMAFMSILGLVGERDRRSAVYVAGSFPLALLMLLAASQGNLRPAYEGRLVAEFESDNNYIQVLQDGNETLLALNDGHAIHSIYNPTRLETGGPWDYFALGPVMAGNSSPANALLIGLAGGTAARQLHASYPEVIIDGVEIDQTIADVGREYFGMTDDVANITIADGRYALESSDQTYDLICLDAYRQPYVPFHLATVEFFQLASDHLRPEGIVVVNAGRTDRDFRLVDALATTLGKVFETVIAIDVDRYDNTMLYATHGQLSVAQIQQRLGHASTIPLIETVSAWAMDRGNIRVAANDGAVFTDDKAPVEWIIDQIIFDEAVREDQ